MTTLLLGLGALSALAVFTTFLALFFRRVVSTNEVHIVQSAKKTTSYGKDTNNGNTYYEWPSWLPIVGINKMVLPVSVFDLSFHGYEAYDQDRVPFIVDITAFFRINDSNVAAQRVSSFAELNEQLKAIVQGAVRTILAKSNIEAIMQERSKFGQQFTEEVREQLTSWGVETVKNIELMDIRDSSSSHVIKNIMEKKKSHIEMESRQEVAKNMRAAQIAEIEAKRDVDLQNQSALQSVGLRTVENKKEVAVAEQGAIQLVKEQERTTKEKEMAVLKVQEIKKAEIERDAKIIKAQQDKETTVINAEGLLESEKRKAEGILVQGEAKANAEKAMQLAPVEAQIVLAKEIGANESYQKYLITIETVKATQAVGMEQAKALEKADVKIISNTGEPTAGLTNVMDLFSSKGGTKVGAMLEGLAQTEKGEALLKTIGLNGKGH